MALRSVLDELKDAYRRDNHRDPTVADLLAYRPPQAQNKPSFDSALFHGYSDALRALRYAYESLARPSKDPPKPEALNLAVEEFWKYLLTVRDAMSLFTLLRWWRDDSESMVKKKGYSTPQSALEQVAYLHIAVRLLSHAAGRYDANIQARGFTPEEWKFIKTPLHGVWYRSTYDELLKGAFAVDSFRQGAALFLRLHAIGVRADAALARNEEILSMLLGLLGSDPKDLAQRSFSASGGKVRQTVFKIGNTVANHVYIVYFDAKSPVYINFAHTGAVLYSVRREKFASYADQAEYQLIYEATQGMLPLIGLLFMVAASLPGVVANGFAGVVEACLMPVEQKAAEKVMEALGLDPENAGWWVLGINLLARGAAGALRRPGTSGLEQVEDAETTLGRTIEEKSTTDSQQGLNGRSIENRETGSPAAEEQSISGRQADTAGSSAKQTDKSIGWREPEETRAEPVSSRPRAKRASPGSREQGADAEDIESGKGTSKPSQATANRGTTSTSVPRRSARVALLDLGARRKSGARWLLRNADPSEVAASQRGYQVYEYYSADGECLYVGKSGGAGGAKPDTWIDRGWAHIAERPEITEADRIAVRAELTEQEAFAFEQERIAELRPRINISAGEFGARSRQGAADFAANVQSASKRPSYTFDTDMASYSPMPTR